MMWLNILDLVLVASDLGNEGKNLVSDVNGDEVVNILDLVLVARAFGSAAAPANPRALTMLTASDVGRLVGSSASIGFDRCNDPKGCAGARATRGCLDAGGDGIAAKLPESV